MINIETVCIILAQERWSAFTLGFKFDDPGTISSKLCERGRLVALWWRRERTLSQSECGAEIVAASLSVVGRTVVQVRADSFALYI